MVERKTIDDCQELDRFVAALEDAYRERGQADLLALVPQPNHSQYFDIVPELIRVDIEMRTAHGSRMPLEFYEQHFPVIFGRSEDVAAIAFEDYRQRQQAGEPVNACEYRQRWNVDTRGWPQPQSQLLSTAADDERLEVTNASPLVSPDAWPAIGQTFLGFELIALLGRGAFAQVYLARQGELADRPVALKVARRVGDEPQLLAQLQHTNIVPIYSVHSAGPLEAVCMPYYGGVTLAEVLRHIGRGEQTPDSGRALVDTVLAHQQSTLRTEAQALARPAFGAAATTDHQPETLAGAATSLQTLSGLSFVEAVLWIGAGLAQGLSHAHERGILHGDLKPANVLLANDGQPMLLDFNLSHDRKRTSSVSQAHAGGTLPYMSPEALRAYQTGVAEGDERSDIYSLGLILYELLSCQYPFRVCKGETEQVLIEALADRRQPIARLRKLNRSVTPAMEAIVLRCLQYDPKHRYRSARQLHEDLQRQLDNRTLRYTREPSLVERGQKWLRRHPRIASSSGVATVAAVVIAIIGSVLLVRSGRLATLEARERLVALEHSVQSAQILFLDALDDRPDQQPSLEKTLTQALAYFDKPSDGQYLSRLSPEELRRARAARAEAMFLQAAELSRQAELSTEEAECKVLWTRALDSNRRASELLEVDARPVTALASQAALLSEHLELPPRLGKPTGTLPPNRQLGERVPASAHQLGWSAALLTAQRRYREARPQWESATRAEPRNVWTWYGLGHCYERLGEHALAAECYSACIALAPEQMQWYFRRGLAHLHENLPALAREDFTTVLDHDPQHTDARINRALASLALDAPAQAIEDLSQAIAEGNHSARVFLMRAQARERAGDSSGAQADREAGFSRPADDEHGWTAQGVLRAQSDPRAALQDFDKALRINPSFLPALESKAHVLAEQLDDSAGAIRVLDEAIGRHPEESVILAAKGVLLARQGRTEDAKALAEKALAIDSSASILYQVATLYALVSREEQEASERAFALLTAALRAGFGADLLADDRDLDPLRNDPRFERLSSAMQTLTAAPEEAIGNNESAGGR